MNIFKIFYNWESIELQAESSYDAQQKALAIYQSKTRKKIKWYNLSVISLWAYENWEYIYN